MSAALSQEKSAELLLTILLGGVNIWAVTIWPVEYNVIYLYAGIMLRQGSVMAPPKIGFICGSLRAKSINAKLMSALILKTKAAGAEVQILDLGDYALPLLHADLELPAGVERLKADMLSCGGIIMVTPEYNGSLPPLLKNAIDWLSMTGTEQFKTPLYGIASCTPGPMSGIMVLRELNYILTRVGADVISPHVGTGRADQAFSASGELTIQPSADLADQMIANLLSRLAQKS